MMESIIRGRHRPVNDRTHRCFHDMGRIRFPELAHPSWFVHELELPDDHVRDEARGPLAPLGTLWVDWLAFSAMRWRPDYFSRCRRRHP
jgi:hypothetical protein